VQSVESDGLRNWLWLEAVNVRKKNPVVDAFSAFTMCFATERQSGRTGWTEILTLRTSGFMSVSLLKGLTRNILSRAPYLYKYF
jgi:hypothetical protein